MTLTGKKKRLSRRQKSRDPKGKTKSEHQSLSHSISSLDDVGRASLVFDGVGAGSWLTLSKAENRSQNDGNRRKALSGKKK